MSLPWWARGKIADKTSPPESVLTARISAAIDSALTAFSMRKCKQCWCEFVSRPPVGKSATQPPLNTTEQPLSWPDCTPVSETSCIDPSSRAHQLPGRVEYHLYLIFSWLQWLIGEAPLLTGLSSTLTDSLDQLYIVLGTLHASPPSTAATVFDKWTDAISTILWLQRKKAIHWDILLFINVNFSKS